MIRDKEFNWKEYAQDCERSLIEQRKTIAELQAKLAEQVCEWREIESNGIIVAMESKCGTQFCDVEHISEDLGNYCGFCGGKIKIVKPQ